MARCRRWSVDPAALAEAIEFLGLTRPVWITVSQGYRCVGWSQTGYGWQLPARAPKALQRADIVHHIAVSKHQTAAEASRTLWHELAHAMQGERAMDAGDPCTDPITAMRRMRAYFNAEHAIPYRIRPIEREAEGYEQFARELPLCVPAGIHAV